MKIYCCIIDGNILFQGEHCDLFLQVLFQSASLEQFVNRLLHDAHLFGSQWSIFFHHCCVQNTHCCGCHIWGQHWFIIINVDDLHWIWCGCCGHFLSWLYLGTCCGCCLAHTHCCSWSSCTGCSHQFPCTWCIRSLLDQVSNKLLNFWCHSLGLTLCSCSCRFASDDWSLSELCCSYCSLCLLNSGSMLFGHLLGPLTCWILPLLAHSHGLYCLWVWHSCIHGDELLHILWLLLHVWKDECWLSWVG